MINLLLDNDKKVLAKVYRYRLLTVGLGLVSISIVLATVLLIPSYIATTTHVGATRLLVEKNQHATEVALHNQLKDKVTDQGRTVKVLSPENTISITGIIDTIIRDKTPGDSITVFNYSVVTDKDKKTFTLLVQGVAQSRKSLQDFTNAVGREKGITSVEVPVSNFTKESSIQYSFTVKGTL